MYGEHHPLPKTVEKRTVVPVSYTHQVPVEKLNRLTRGNHQGVVAQISPIGYVELNDILERVPEDEDVYKRQVYVPASWKLLTKEYPVKGRVSWQTYDALHERLCAVRYRTVW